MYYYRQILWKLEVLYSMHNQCFYGSSFPIHYCRQPLQSSATLCPQMAISGRGAVIKWGRTRRDLHQPWDRWRLSSRHVESLCDEDRHDPQLGGDHFCIKTTAGREARWFDLYSNLWVYAFTSLVGQPLHKIWYVAYHTSSKNLAPLIFQHPLQNSF